MSLDKSRLKGDAVCVATNTIADLLRGGIRFVFSPSSPPRRTGAILVIIIQDGQVIGHPIFEDHGTRRRITPGPV